MQKLRRYKNVLGISLLEVILALGIMSMLAPVVIKLAFKDLGDIKYLNLSKQLKQFTKSLAVYSSSKISSWHNGKTDITEDLKHSDMKDVINKKLLEKSKIVSIKLNNKFVVYAKIDMSETFSDIALFKKTLMYAEDNIGYIVKDDCGSCFATYCMCSINGDWGIKYFDVFDDDIDKNNFIAVLRVDEDLLEKENKSKLYLYRNAQGGNEGNIMERDLLFDEANGKDIKNIKNINIQYLNSEAIDSSNINSQNLLSNTSNFTQKIISNNVHFDGSNVVANNVILTDDAYLHFNAIDSKIYVNNINFESIKTPNNDFIPSTLGGLKVPNACLKKDSLSKNKDQNLIVDNLEARSIDARNMIIKDLNEQEINLKSISDKLKSAGVISIPSANIEKIKTTILNINNLLDLGNLQISDGSFIYKKNNNYNDSNFMQYTANIQYDEGNKNNLDVNNFYHSLDDNLNSLCNRTSYCNFTD